MLIHTYPNPNKLVTLPNNFSRERGESFLKSLPNSLLHHSHALCFLPTHILLQSNKHLTRTRLQRLQLIRDKGGISRFSNNGGLLSYQSYSPSEC